MINVLCIGNSFSQDATVYLQSICYDMRCVNLYIPGCNLKTHCFNLENNIINYEYQINGNKVGELVSLNDIIEKEKWDYITLQQYSGESGLFYSISPFLSRLIEYIKQKQQNAKICFHETWAYAKNSQHHDFKNYDFSQEKMFQSIIETNNKIKKQYNLSIISVGEAIQKIRKEYPQVKDDMCRDGFHLSKEGRYIASYVFAKFFGAEIKNFIPNDLDKNLIEKYLKILK